MDGTKYDFKEAVKKQLRHCAKADSDILYFIERFRCGGGTSSEKQEVIRKTFMAGYCLYFAKILQDAFPGGEICWAAPYGHIVYVSQGVPYDIEGISITEADHFIPISEMGDTINDFRHVPGLAHNTTEQEIAEIITNYQGKKQEKKRRRMRL